MGLGYACAGAALVAIPARHWRIDRLAPPHAASGDHAWAFGLVYAVAVLCLANGWRLVAASRPRLAVALLSGALVHAIALASPPFMSLDPLCYAAIGRVLARFHGSAYRPLSESLPAGDAYLVGLPPLWRGQGSAYSIGFNELARYLSFLGGNDRGRFLQFVQRLGCVALLATAWLTALAVGVRRPAARGQAAAIVLFCPLGILEGTVGAHNDAFLALGAAAFALAVEQRRTAASVAALVTAATIKASGFLLLIMRLTQLVLAQRGARARLRLYAVPLALMALAATAVLLAVMSHFAALRLPLALIGLPGDAPHCTRSVECIPRAILYWGAHDARAAWLVGLCFRLAGIGWLGYVGFRSALEPERTLAWAGAGLFVYYLFLHGYSQGWYLLPLLPLLPFAPARLRPAMKLFCVTALLYYAVRLPLQDDLRPQIVALRELVEGLIVIVPPSILLATERRQLMLHRRKRCVAVDASEPSLV